jgi:hypothetical protein
VKGKELFHPLNFYDEQWAEVYHSRNSAKGFQKMAFFGWFIFAESEFNRNYNKHLNSEV